MNHSLLSADRNTHLKMVILALIAAIAVVVIGITARLQDATTVGAQFHDGTQVFRAGQPLAFTQAERSWVR